jgi:hypothetical protein
MYDSYMKSTQYPLQVPEDIMAEIESTAEKVHLSKADVMRQAMKIGLPKLREQLTARDGRLMNVDPLPDAVLRRLYARRDDNPEGIEQVMAAQPIRSSE